VLTPIRVGVVGVGFWGSKLARNVSESEGCTLAALVDPDPGRLAGALARHPGADGVASVSALVARDDIDAVVLATPASIHGEQAAVALAAGKDVFVEKPLALSTFVCDRLIQMADRAGRILMVGHTFCYAPPVRALRAIIERGELGRIAYAYSQRLNLGEIRQDTSAMWDLAPHDLSILRYLLGAAPERVSSRQFPLVGSEAEDVSFLVLEYPGGVVAHVHDSRLDPRKVRQLTVVGDQMMAVYDDMDAETPLRLYDKGVDRAPNLGEGFGEFRYHVRAGDMRAPKIEPREPLREEIEHFARCCADRTQPLTDGRNGREIVATLEAAERSARAFGVAVEVEAAPAAVSGEVLVGARLAA
jgi:predicted dehydrogenase